MKAEYIKPNVLVNPRSPKPPADKVETRANGTTVWKVGAIVSHPHAYRLVQMGVAVPADDECIRRANMTPHQMAEAQFAQEALSKFIEVKHKELYRHGLIAGYDYNRNLFVLGENASSASDHKNLFTADDWNLFQLSIKAVTDEPAIPQSDDDTSDLDDSDSGDLDGDDTDSTTSQAGGSTDDHAGGDANAAATALSLRRSALRRTDATGADQVAE